MDKSRGRQRLAPRIWQHDWYCLVKLRRAIERALPVAGVASAGQRVVDLGCGDCPYEPLVTAAGYRYVACDLGQGSDVTIVPGQRIPLDDVSADGVVSFQVLEHVWDLDWYLGECRRLLKPGGWLLLSTHGTWLYHAVPTDFRRWTRDGLCKELTSRGFLVDQVQPVVGPLAWTTLFRLFGIREVLLKVPALGPTVLAPLALFMNLRMLFEDAVTPARMIEANAAVYLTRSRKPP